MPWAYGQDFKNSAGNKLLGGVGIYGDSSTPQHVYLGFGTEPWTNGLKINTNSIFFKGNKVYHAGDKPTLSDIGAAAANHSHSYLPLSGGTLTGYLTLGGTLQDNRITTGNKQLMNTSGSIIYCGNPATNLQLESKSNPLISVSGANYTLYHTGNKPSASEIGAATSGHTHSSVKINDVRSTNPTPNEYADNTISTFFNDQYGDGWRSGITLKGWSGTYSAWQISNPASTSATEGLNFRVGAGTSWGPWRKIYHEGFKPTASDVGAVSTSSVSTGGDANKIVQRDSAGDVNARLLRTTYQNENYINGAIAFRTNNSSDNYTRYCSNPTAVRDWIGAAASNHGHNNMSSRGIQTAQSGRNQSWGDVYSYNTTAASHNGPTTYTSIMGFGRGVGGTVEIAGEWTSGKGLWFRALRDTTDNWYPWTRVYTEAYKPTPSAIGALGVNDKAASASNSDAVNGRVFKWEYGSGNPTHIWGSSGSSTNMQVWDPKNITVGRATNANSADAVAWGNVTGKPSTFAPSSHNHTYIVGGTNNKVQVDQPNDFAGLDKKNNVNIDTWYGFSVSNKCASDIPVDGVAFSVNARNGMVWAKGDIYAKGNQRVYHTGFKPSLSDIGAAASSHTHDDRYVRQVSNFGYWGLTANGNTSDWVRTTASGLIPYSTDGGSNLGTSSWQFNNAYIKNIYEGGTALSAKYAPSNHSHSSIECTKNQYWIDNGVYGLKLNNSDIIGANGIYFYDTSDVDNGEGLMFLKSGKSNDSRTKADYDNLLMKDGYLYLNGTKKSNWDTDWLRYIRGFSATNLDIVVDQGRLIYISPNATSGANIYIDARYQGSDAKSEVSVINSKGSGYGYLGGSDRKWFRMYASGGGITSFREDKHHITKADLDELYEDVKNLNIYKYRSVSRGDDGDVLERQDLMLGTMIDELPLEVVEYDTENGDGKSLEIYSYATLIMATTKVLQKKVETLEEENERLLQRLDKMEGLINGIIHRE